MFESKFFLRWSKAHSSIRHAFGAVQFGQQAVGESFSNPASGAVGQVESVRKAYSVPRRSDLIEQLRRANQFAWISIPTRLILIVVLLVAIDWNGVVEDIWLPLIAVVSMVGPTIHGLLMFAVSSKKEVGQLKETTRFGEFDKMRIRDLFRQTLTKLGLPDEHLPVYITPDKSLNAGAMHLGLAGFFRSLNGIYLNRQLLHKLSAEELQDTMGHELGHYYRYYLVGERFQIITLMLGALVGIFIAQLINLDDFLAWGVLAVSAWVFWFLSSIPFRRNIRAIEYLCDDFGAQVNGVVVSINSLLKLGADAELQVAIFQKMILANANSKLDAKDLVEGIVEAVPFGHASREEIERAIEQKLKHRTAERNKPSLSGLIRYLWVGDGDDDQKAELVERAGLIARLQAKQRLNWESLLSNPQHIQLTNSQVEQLVAMMEREPQLPLFRILTSEEEQEDEHPPLENRILYLWRNRQEIESHRPAGRRLMDSGF